MILKLLMSAERLLAPQTEATGFFQLSDIKLIIICNVYVTFWWTGNWFIKCNLCYCGIHLGAQSFIYLRPLFYSPSVFHAPIFCKTCLVSNEGHRRCLSLSQLSGGTSGVAILIAIAGLTSNRPCCYEVFVQTAAAPCCYFLTLYTFRTLFQSLQ